MCVIISYYGCLCLGITHLKLCHLNKLGMKGGGGGAQSVFFGKKKAHDEKTSF